MDCSLVPRQRIESTMPPNFAEKTYAKNHKTVIFVKVFSLESLPLYGISGYAFGGSCKPVALSFIQDIKTLLCM